MKCRYCKSKCKFILSASDYEKWKCISCWSGIDVTYYVELRDAQTLIIEIIVPHKEHTYVFSLDLIKKTTTITTASVPSETIASLNHIMKVSPKIIEDKLKTILTFQ